MRSYPEDEVTLQPDDKPREACGVFGIFNHPEAARLTYYGLYALQHRGQESAGIACVTERGMVVHKDMGLVSEVFDHGALEQLTGTAALGHVRYSTTGSSVVANAQPLVIIPAWGGACHNGNLVNAGQIREELEENGSIFQTTLDTEVLAHLIARLGKNGLEEAVMRGMQVIQGGYAFGIMTENSLMGLRDPNGIRPLAIGRLGDAWVLSSESCAFDTIGAEWCGSESGELV